MLRLATLLSGLLLAGCVSQKNYDAAIEAAASHKTELTAAEARIANLESALVDAGVDPLNVASVGYGEHRPTASNDTADSRAKNRRIEIVLVPKLQSKDALAAQ